MTEKQFIDKERFDDIDHNLSVIREKIAQAAADSGRKADEIRLMAVTKTVDPVYINHAIEAGIDLIGENKVQEYLGKKPELRQCEAHLIGHLQTNKVRQIVGEVAMIQSVDSVRLAAEIGKRSLQAGLVTDILCEINIGGEESKTGLPLDGVKETVAEIAEIEGVRLRGLMAVPPICEKIDQTRRFFSKMRQLFVDIQSENKDNKDINVLSMGMSSDYDRAVLEGSTLVRVGTSVFGPRIYR